MKVNRLFAPVELEVALLARACDLHAHEMSICLSLDLRVAFVRIGACLHMRRIVWGLRAHVAFMRMSVAWLASASAFAWGIHVHEIDGIHAHVCCYLQTHDCS